MKKILTTALVFVIVFVGFMLMPDSDNDEKCSDEASSTQSYSEEYVDECSDSDENENYQDYRFRNYNLLNNHYEKHGKEMGFSSADEYEQAASDVVNNPDALHKTESEDGDDIFYVEATNEFVVVSTDGFIRTYFCPDAGKRYFDRQ